MVTAIRERETKPRAGDNTFGTSLCTPPQIFTKMNLSIFLKRTSSREKDSSDHLQYSHLKNGEKSNELAHFMVESEGNSYTHVYKSSAQGNWHHTNGASESTEHIWETH